MAETVNAFAFPFWQSLAWPFTGGAAAAGAAGLLPLLPLLAFAVGGLFLRWRPGAASGLALLVTAWCLAAAARLLALAWQSPFSAAYPFFGVAIGRFHLAGGLLVDRLAAVMLVVVATVSLLVQVYSTGYMAGDKGYGRYFSYLALFTAAMFGLVLANNLLQMYVFYELVGLASFLLIGFWYEQPGPVAASRKAFVTTRIGDFGLLLGLLLLFWHTGTLDWTGLKAAAPSLAPGILHLGALLVFSGAAGKSAQFPLHVWLPDAMAGPTPVSALIHAATMVAAGVYLVGRIYPVLAAAPAGAFPLAVIAGIGAFTSLLAATVAVAQDDLKRVLAYSTISQLGLMMLGLGSRGYEAGLFHLVTHAFFKALLFLGAGSVIFRFHHEQDIWRMGGLGRKMPVTAVTFAIGTLALAGVPPLAGFWSKDAVLGAAFAQGAHSSFYLVLFFVGLLASFLTAFYMARLFFLVFTGKRNEKEEAQGRHDWPHGHDAEHEHHGEVTESPAVMWLPLVILAIPATLLGYLGHRALGEGEALNLTVAGASTLVALLGLFLGWLLYGRRRPTTDPLAVWLGGFHPFLKAGYRIDDLYTWLGDIFVRGLAAILRWFDRTIVDGAVDAVGAMLIWLGGWLRRLQSGWVQRYLLYVATAIFLLILVWLLKGPEIAGMGGVRW
ncbi:MAG: NADH-quinone oxidoreductase subunit L [Chitinophagales bacterium]